MGVRGGWGLSVGWRRKLLVAAGAYKKVPLMEDSRFFKYESMFPRIMGF